MPLRSIGPTKTLVTLELPNPVEPGADTWQLDVGLALFTRSGREMASIIESKSVNGFCEHIVAIWEQAGFKPTTHEAHLERSDESTSG
jgi:hypothetical protein